MPQRPVSPSESLETTTKCDKISVICFKACTSICSCLAIKILRQFVWWIEKLVQGPNLNQINTFKSYNPKLKLHLRMHCFHNALASTPPPCSRKVITPINSNQVAKTFDQISKKLVKFWVWIFNFFFLKITKWQTQPNKPLANPQVKLIGRGGQHEFHQVLV